MVTYLSLCNYRRFVVEVIAQEGRFMRFLRHHGLAHLCRSKIHAMLCLLCVPQNELPQVSSRTGKSLTLRSTLVCRLAKHLRYRNSILGVLFTTTRFLSLRSLPLNPYQNNKLQMRQFPRGVRTSKKRRRTTIVPFATAITARWIFFFFKPSMLERARLW